MKQKSTAEEGEIFFVCTIFSAPLRLCGEGFCA